MFGAPVITSSGYCSHLMPEIGAAIDRFRKMLRMQCRQITVGSPPFAKATAGSMCSAFLLLFSRVLQSFFTEPVAEAWCQDACTKFTNPSWNLSKLIRRW